MGERERQPPAWNIAQLLERLDGLRHSRGKFEPMPPTMRATYLLGIRDCLDLLKRGDPAQLIAAIWKLDSESRGLLDDAYDRVLRDTPPSEAINILFGPPGDGASAGERPS